MDYNCAAETVRKYMWREGRDCNGDGVSTCEDYVLIHRYGRTGCLNYMKRDEGFKLFEHQPCLNTMIASNYIYYSPPHKFKANWLLVFFADRGRYHRKSYV